MRFFFIISLLSQCLVALGQKDQSNVLSYYAVTNSIDGQPFIDKQNLLRFYPVFAFRDSIKSVNVTIYYGNHIFIEQALKQKNGLYWQVKLPEFDLGDAIQRYEVETVMEYETNVKQEIAQYKKIMIGKQTDLEGELEQAKKDVKSFQDLVRQLSIRFDAINKMLLSSNPNLLRLYGNIQSAADASQLPKGLEDSFKASKKKIDSLLASLEPGNLRDNLNQIKSNVENLTLLFTDWQQSFFILKLQIKRALATDTLNQRQYVKAAEEILKLGDLIDAFAPKFYDIGEKQKDVIRYITVQEKVIDTLKINLIGKLIDQSLTGIGIQKSDIVFFDDYKRVKILYRNYKDQNRKLVVLDPAEKLSIFKVRYIPFPVVGSTLVGPNQDGIPIVFEVGLTFGNQVITSNEFYTPSIERLGIAVAITPQLFSKDAKVLALLLTYDFNTYASIGIGANFGTGVNSDPVGINPVRKVEPYFSFGINQKAFQRLVVGIANVFR